MSKKTKQGKYQQNQSLVSDETKNKVVSDSQQNESQPDATAPQEHGRSMTEMLGVLAVIGVLSIGGVQGYRYAMNKYHSNEVINELNMLNAQLAIFMSGIHDEEAVMSLGEPYDDARRINTGGYAFDYGCGQDPDSNSPCDFGETGYFMTLSGLPKDVCKSASQMTANMMNLVEQRVNSDVDDEGVSCRDGNNQVTFLFDANGEGGRHGGNGNNNGNEDTDVILPPEPDVDEPAEESTTTIFEVTEPEITEPEVTDTYIETETYTYTATYSNAPTCDSYECKENSDCASKGTGYYCDIQCYNDYCTKDTSNMGGVCRKTSSDVKTPNSGTNPPFVMSSRSMMWWSAKNFCQSLGKTLVEVSDYGCAHTICPSGCNSTWGYCHADTSMGVTSSSTTNISANVAAMKAAYGSSYGWTNTDYNSCNAYSVYFVNGNVYDTHRTNSDFAVCK